MKYNTSLNTNLLINVVADLPYLRYKFIISIDALLEFCEVLPSDAR